MIRRAAVAPRATPPGHRRRDQRGLVTVELAIGFLTVAMVTALMVTVVLLAGNRAMLARAGAEVARQLARGDAAAAQRARAEAPPGARFTTADRDGGVEVAARLDSVLVGGLVVPLSATSWARYEPGAGP